MASKQGGAEAPMQTASNDGANAPRQATGKDGANAPRQVRIRELHIANFKGCESLDLEFGDVTDIYGANATGKTTIVDAVHWLLFGKDSAGAASFDIRPLDRHGNTVDKVDIVVQATLEDDGKEVTLRKLQKQNWVKKRGEKEPRLTGNTNEYEVDGFPANEKEYRASVEGIIPEDLFRLLTDPRTFPSLPWKQQRDIVARFAEGVTDASILEKFPDKYEAIREDLERAPIEKCVEKAKKVLNEYTSVQKGLPARIEEAGRVAEETDEARLEAERAILLEQISDREIRMRDARAANEADERMRDELAQCRAELADWERNEREELERRRKAATKKISDCEGQIAEMQGEIGRATGKAARLRAEVEEEAKAQEELVGKWREAKAMAMDEGDTVCKMCGQPLPPGMLDEAKSGFEKRKADLIGRITEEGNARKERVTQMRGEMEKLEDGANSLRNDMTSANETLAQARKELAEIPEEPDMDGNPHFAVLKRRAAELEEKVARMPDGAGNALMDEIREMERKRAEIGFKLDAAKDARKRVEDLQGQLRGVSQKAADQEKKLYLLEEFQREKMAVVSGEVNGKFGDVHFKLFEEQINGGIKDTCEMGMGGVPYQSLNSAGKLQAGLMVINALSGLYGVCATVFLDNRESVSEIPQTQAQLVNLYVSPGDSDLRIEKH